MSVFKDVLAFITNAAPENILDKPGTPSEATRKLCKALIDGEVNIELLPAIDSGDLVEIADGIADSLYVLIYTAYCHGIPIERIWDEVQRTNMAKFENGVVIKRLGDGKVMKPAGWVPPDIAGILTTWEVTKCRKHLVNACDCAQHSVQIITEPQRDIEDRIRSADVVWVNAEKTKMRLRYENMHTVEIPIAAV